MKTTLVQYTKVFVLIFFTLSIKISESQISSYYFEATKNYDDNRTISYFLIDGIKDRHQEYYINKQLNENTDILQFHIYKKEGNSNRCMIETKKNFNNNEIIELINKEIENYNTLKSVNYKNKWDFFKIIYDIPDDCPVFNYGEITKENKEAFISDINKWKLSNPEKYNEIKHLKEEIEILKN